MSTGKSGRRNLFAATAIIGCLGWGFSTSVQAVGFQSSSGEITGSWDTTISFGQGWRVSDRDCRIIGTADGGCGRSPNIDDGDLNYGKGTFSKAFKALTELALNYKDKGGVFVRADALYDFAVMDEKTARTPLSHE